MRALSAAQSVRIGTRSKMRPSAKRVYVVGTADTKGQERDYVRALVRDSGVPAVLVDVGIRPAAVAVDVTAHVVAAFHPRGADHVLRSDDRGSAVAAMGEAFARYVGSLDDVGGDAWFSVAAAGRRSLLRVCARLRSAYPKSWCRPLRQAT